MSIGLTPFDISSLAIGQSGKIDLTKVMNIGGMNPQKKPTVRLHNESGSGLYVVLPNSGQSFNFPAGGWVDCQLQPGETSINFTVLYLLPNPPVTLLMGTFYGPNETVPPMTILGNSPIGIGGTIQTSSVQTLSNEGNPANQLVIDIGDVSLSQLIQIFTDHFTLKVDQSGVAHFVLRGQTAGNPVLIGQTGDTSEVAGNLLIDGTLTSTGDITANGAGTGLAVANNETVGGTLGVTGVTTHTGNVIANGGMNIGTIRDNSTGTTQATLATAGITLQNILTLLAGLDVTGGVNASGGYSIASNLLLSASVNTHLTAVPGGQIIFDVTGTPGAGLIDARGVVSGGSQGFTFPSGGFLPNLSFFTGVATGTYNHGFGSSPFWVCPMTTQAGSQTMGYDSVTSTQVHITSFSGLSFKAACM